MTEIFQLGEEASKAKFEKALTSMQRKGSDVLSTLDVARTESLVEFDRRLQAINGRRTRAWRVISPGQVTKFVVSDFTDIDQTNTTGTVRIDSSAVSLKERKVPAEAVIKNKTFSADKGTIEALDATKTILRVHTDDFSVPTGQFDLELVTPLTLNQLIIDIVSTPSDPTVVASISGDGLTYTPATQIALSGYRVNIWLPSIEARFIRIRFTPSHPDDLNGNTFTFGITSFSAQSTSYHLRSEVLSKTLTFSPQTEYVVFDAPEDSNVQYYISIWAANGPQAPFIEITPNDAIAIGTKIHITAITNASVSGVIASIPSDVYINTIQVKESGVDLKFAPGLSQSDINVTDLANEYVGLEPTSVGYDLILVRGDGDYSATRTFDVLYIHGPSQINVQLRTRLSTHDSAVSPVFRGIVLDGV